jgi:hypothetical protein
VDEEGLLIPRTRSRQNTVRVSGDQWYGLRPASHTKFDTSVVYEYKRTSDRKNLFPFVQHQLRKGGIYAKSVDGLKMLDLGWSFHSETIRRSASLSSFAHTSYAATLNQEYGVVHTGPVFLAACLGPLAPWGKTQWEQRAQIDFGLGGTAISRVRPNKPEVDLSVTLGELRFGGLPTMIGSLMSRSMNVLDVFRNGGKEYLNVQFGWKPLVSDLLGLAQLVTTARSKIEQYERDLSREIRRRYTFEPKITTITSSKAINTDSQYWVQFGTPLGNSTSNINTFSGSTNQGTYSKTTTEQSWFSGAFRYFNADVQDSLADLRKFEEHANLLLGTRLDPEVIWNLQPWTWLIDWFVNYGDVLGNFSALAFDRQVLHYGYLMTTVTDKEEWTAPGLFARSGPTFLSTTRVAGTVANTRTAVRKIRSHASPFGFGLDPDAFTADQWAILAALGMSRGGNHK